MLDPFGGSGSTLIAAERTKRKARLIEIDPHYCDIIVRRWQVLSGRKVKDAVLGGTFDESAALSTASIPSKATSAIPEPCRTAALQPAEKATVSIEEIIR